MHTYNHDRFHKPTYASSRVHFLHLDRGHRQLAERGEPNARCKDNADGTLAPTHTHILSLDTRSLRLVSSPSILQFRYLSNEQVLADYAQLLQSLAPSDGSVGPPVVAIGGSYGGMLAVYLRLKYPWLVAGALGSSAPIAGGPGACVQGCAQFRECVKRAQTACSAVFSLASAHFTFCRLFLASKTKNPVLLPLLTHSDVQLPSCTSSLTLMLR
jgi:pimeloyl-ACP methyl ester carboxylesterase